MRPLHTQKISFSDLFNNPAREGFYSSLPACGCTRHTSIIDPTMPLGASNIVMMKNSPMTRIARSVCSPRKSFRKCTKLAPTKGASHPRRAAGKPALLAGRKARFAPCPPRAYFPGSTLIEMVAAHLFPKERCRPSANCIVSL